jgi:hypothetical protein
MNHIAWPRLLAVLLLSSALCFVAAQTLAGASGRSQAGDVELDHFISQDKWASTGLNKLTIPEQRALAGEIAALLRTASSAEKGAPSWKDRSQWRMLQRGMSKDDVRKLLGEPERISVSRFAEFWDYLRGSVTFDGKGRVDSWTEP